MLDRPWALEQLLLRLARLARAFLLPQEYPSILSIASRITMAPDLSFGPQGDQWYYTRDTRTYDLTRGNDQGGSETQFTLATTQGPTDTSVTIDPAKSALVVVDMQNYFLDAQCRDYPAGLATVEPLLKVIEKCREVGVQVSLCSRVSWLPYRIRRFIAGKPCGGVSKGERRKQA